MKKNAKCKKDKMRAKDVKSELAAPKMSRVVDTSLGLFRQWQQDGNMNLLM